MRTSGVFCIRINASTDSSTMRNDSRLKVPIAFPSFCYGNVNNHAPTAVLQTSVNCSPSSVGLYNYCFNINCTHVVNSPLILIGEHIPPNKPTYDRWHVYRKSNSTHGNNEQQYFMIQHKSEHIIGYEFQQN